MFSLPALTTAPHHLSLSTAGKSVDDQLVEVATTLLRRGLLVRCQRRFNKPPPGQDRLIKFPKKVVLVQGPDAQRFSELDFYAFTFDRPTSPMVYVFSVLAALGVILVTLFPLTPNWFKAGVVYFLATLLSVIVFTLVIRAVIAAVSYIGTGRTVWVLPNALADDKPLSELFSPLIDVVEPEIAAGGRARATHYLTRLALAAVLGGVTWVLYTRAPGKEGLRKNAFKYRDDLFDLFNVNNDPKLITKGNSTDSGAGSPVVNETLKEAGDDGFENNGDGETHKKL